jgi:hypothetical protein
MIAGSLTDDQSEYDTGNDQKNGLDLEKNQND